MHSMTGFGRAEAQLAGSVFTVEVKSVNHRYLDARFRLPPSLSQYEIALSEVLRSQFERGSFEVFVKQKVAATGSSIATGTRFVVDESAAKSFLEGCHWLHEKHKTEKIPTLEAVVATNRIFVSVDDGQESTLPWDPVKALFESALKELAKMRASEGKKLKQLFKDGLNSLRGFSDGIFDLSKAHPARIQEKLKARIAQWQIPNLDAQRLEWEVAFYADRADITEEIDRLRAHANEFEKLLDSSKSVGRKLDFLTQELHREVNTMASKAQTIEITRLAVEAKTCIEKLREQVQNVE